MKPLALLITCVLLAAFLNAQTTLTPLEKRTDSVAQKLFQLLNNRQTDSAYLLASQSFKNSLPYDRWVPLSETKLYTLLPFTNLEFKGSKNGVSKYLLPKKSPLQILISIDANNKYRTFLIGAYEDDNAKKEELSATDNVNISALDKTVDRLVGNYINTIGNVGVSVAVFYNGKDYYYNYGETVKDNLQLPNQKTLYQIASITKTFTATLLAKAVVDKKVGLQDAITKYLPDSVAENPDLQNITLQQLSNHSSGLPRLPANFWLTGNNILQPYENYDDNALFAFLKQFKAIRKPGETYEYSNLAVGVLGVILERIYKKPYEQLLLENIVEPLGLTHTKIVLNDIDRTMLSQGYNEKDQTVPAWNFKSLAACGALISCSEDLLQYGKQQLSEFRNPLSKYFKLTHQPTFNDKVHKVGLGWRFLIYETDEVLWHNGSTNGYKTVLCINKNKNIVVTVLTNNATNGDALGAKLMQAIERL